MWPECFLSPRVLADAEVGSVAEDGLFHDPVPDVVPGMAASIGDAAVKIGPAGSLQ